MKIGLLNTTRKGLTVVFVTATTVKTESTGHSGHHSSEFFKKQRRVSFRPGL